MSEECKMIETHLYSSDEKLSWWGYGEWLEEPDNVTFIHEGIECIVIRIVAKEICGHMFGGHLCGYIKIPDDHHFYSKNFMDFDNGHDLDVHGGITYSEIDNKNHSYLPNEGHWIGFDCAHSGDYIPSMEYLRKTDPIFKQFNEGSPIFKKYKHLAIFNPSYKNIAFCIDECKSMAEQINLVKK